MSELPLEIKSLVKSYNNQTVLSGVDLQLNAGEYLGLIGVNGAGKTTLIKAILDFISIDDGSITIFGKSHLKTLSREAVSFLPEKFLPPYYLTGQDFLAYMSKLNQIDLIESDVFNIFSVLDLDKDALFKPVRQYSKGMAQKLGLASCFLSMRPMLIFDEPMSGLDPKARAYLKRHLLALKEMGKTLFFSTHLLADVESLCDRIIILHGGKVSFNGSPSECCDKFNKDNLEDAYLTCIGAQV